MRTSDKPTPSRRPDPLETPLLISVSEAARLLGVGTTFGWTMVRRGEIPTVKLGRRVLVPPAAVEQLVVADQAQQRASGP